MGRNGAKRSAMVGTGETWGAMARATLKWLEVVVTGDK